MAVGDGKYRFGIYVTAYDERHIRELIKALVATVQKLGRDLADRGNRAADVAAHTMMLVHRLQKPIKATVGRIVVVHAYFLGNNANLGLHRFFWKIRVSDKIKKLAERFLEAIGTAEQICRFVERGVGIGVGAVFRKALESIASVLRHKELMLQKVRDAVGNGHHLRLGSQTEGIVQ